MHVVVTYLKLKSPFKLVQLAKHAIRIRKQLKATDCVLHKTTGFLTRHYTLSAWKDEETIDQFYRTGAHLEAMKTARNMASEIRTMRMKIDHVPSWKEAKKMIKEGKLAKL